MRADDTGDGERSLWISKKASLQ